MSTIYGEGTKYPSTKYIRSQRIDEMLERESVLFLPFDERYISDEIRDSR